MTRSSRSAGSSSDPRRAPRSARPPAGSPPAAGALRLEGRIKSWNGERGYGFIEPAHGGDDLFVHVKSIPPALRPPRIGQSFSFEFELDGEGRKRAANLVASPTDRTARVRRRKPSGPRGVVRAVAIPLFAFVFLAVATAWRVSPWVLLAYVGLSGFCLFAYAADQDAARTGRWRWSERSLLLIGLAGGWPGAVVAQQVLRHKSRKASFQFAFWWTVVLNVAGFVLVHTPFVASLRA